MVDRFERFSFAIFEISRYWHKITTEELARYGLKGPHATYLTTMYRFEDGITAPQLCELCGKDKADVSRAMSLMEEKGLVKRDGAAYRGKLMLTGEGKAAAEHVRRRAALAVEMAGKDLTDESRVIFYQALESITANMRELSKEGLPQQ